MCSNYQKVFTDGNSECQTEIPFESTFETAPFNLQNMCWFFE